jgi:hypothetical protein
MLFSTINHVLPQLLVNGIYTEPDIIWQQPTSLSDVYAAVAFGRIGVPYSFTYSSSDSVVLPYIQWYPDFPGCEAADNSPVERKYGIAGVQLSFDIYQAI